MKEMPWWMGEFALPSGKRKRAPLPFSTIAHFFLVAYTKARRPGQPRREDRIAALVCQVSRDLDAATTEDDVDLAAQRLRALRMALETSRRAGPG